MVIEKSVLLSSGSTVEFYRDTEYDEVQIMILGEPDDNGFGWMSHQEAQELNSALGAIVGPVEITTPDA